MGGRSSSCGTVFLTIFVGRGRGRTPAGLLPPTLAITNTHVLETSLLLREVTRRLHIPELCREEEEESNDTLRGAATKDEEEKTVVAMSGLCSDQPSAREV